MTRDIEAFFEMLTHKRVGIIGIGVSHLDLIRLFLRKGISVTVLDRREAEKIPEYETLKEEGAAFRLGDTYLESLTDFDVVFRTPGMYYLSEELTQARKNGVAVVSEMEVFFTLCPCRLYAVTGSDGKTTTTTLISRFFEEDGRRVHLGGNIGRALLPLIEEIRPEDVAVVELSSFQLISMRQSPDVAVVTNIAPNHLDVHKGGMQEYIDAKRNLLWHQNGFSRSVLNADNGLSASLAPDVRGELCYFSRLHPVERGAYLDGEGCLCRVKNGVVERIVPKTEIRIPGDHNVENYLAAIAAVGDEVPAASIAKVAREFRGVEHRIEYVRTVDGVQFYNDSIASSPTRTIAGLKSFGRKIIVIAGGYDKKIPYEPLAPYLLRYAKAVVLLGKTAPKIEQAVRGCEGFAESGIQILHASCLEEAVQKARGIAAEGDIVSLSPASASFDLYKNFEERGEHFKQIVRSL